jgi:basic membrane protein A
MPIPPIRRFECGFRQGAAAAGRPVRVIARYLGEGPEVFRDRALSRAEAERMLWEGADIVFAASGHAGTGALDAAAEAGKLGIGVDINQNGRHPGHVLTSAIKRVDTTVYDAFRDAMLGVWSGGVQRVGLAEEAVGWARDGNNEALVEGLAPRLNAVADSLASGELRLDPPCS